MKISHCFSVLLACVLLTGCFGMESDTGNPAPPPPAPVGPGGITSGGGATDVMRAGDKIIIRVTGVPDQVDPQEVLIPATGEVTMPLLTGSFQAVGHTTGDLADEIRNAYKSNKIYTNPNVTIIPEDRFVNVTGDVRNPTRVLYTADLKLLGAISFCGGFDEYANKHKVRILRGKDSFEVDAVQAQKDPSSDPPLSPGDQVYVPRTAW
jgi:protein involved in polysaccharide export with SLBB domain